MSKKSRKSGAKSNAEWMRKGLSRIGRLKVGKLTTGEDIRFRLEKTGHRPTNPHAWGALIRTATERGLLKFTGKMIAMKDIKSHARLTFVYERVA